MTIANTTFPFATTAEGFTGVEQSGGDSTLTYDSGVGNPAGSLKSRISGRNKGPDDNYWEWTGTWEDLGVTAGQVVTQVRLNGADNRCTEWNVGDYATIGPYAIYDSAGTTLIATLWAGRSPTGVEGSWTSVPTQTYQSVSATYEASNTSIRIRLYNQLKNANNGSAAISVQDDTFSIDADYQSATHDLTANSITTSPILTDPALPEPPIKTAVAQFALNTTSGNQDLTTSKLGGSIPKAVIFSLAPVTVNGTPTAGTVFSIGWPDQSGNSQTGCWSADDNVSLTDSGGAFSPDPIMITDAADQLVQARAEFVSWIPNGVRVNIPAGDEPAAAYLVNAWFIAGDCYTKVGSTLMHDTVGQSVSETSPGWTPDILFGMAIIGLVDDGTDNNGVHWRSGWGVAVNDGVETQRGIGAQNRNGVTPSDIRTSLNTNYFVRTPSNTGNTWGYSMEVTSWDANGFTITSRDGARVDTELLWLAIKFNETREFSLQSYATQAAIPGELADTTPGFEPETLLIGMTMAETEDYISETNTIQGVMGLAMADSTDLLSSSLRGDSGVDPSDEACLIDNKINLPNEDGTTGIVASIPSGGIFQSTGFTLDFTAVETNAKRWWVLAIEKGASGTEDNLIATGITTTPVVATSTIGQTHDLDANDVASTPDLTSPILKQTHDLDANSISSSPVLETPTVEEIHVLDANDISSSTVLEAPTIGQTHVLDSNDVSSSPVLETPTLGQTHVLDSNDVSSSPVLETPTVGQTHPLDANDISTSPEVDTSTIGQVHALDSNDISSSPEVGTPTISTEGEDALTANDISTSPEVETPTIGQTHVLDANDISTSPEVETPTAEEIHVLDANNISASPEVETSTIGQTHVLDANNISSSPEVGTPTISTEGEDALTANDISSSPEVETPSMGQEHGLDSNSIAVSTVVGTPTITHIHTLSANNITVNPDVDTPTITHIHNLTSNDVVVNPDVGNPIVGSVGEDNLDANDILTNSVVETPSIGQEHVLSSSAVSTTPTVETPSLSEIHNLSANGVSTVSVVGAPTLEAQGEDTLTATGITTSPEVGTSSIGQEHVLDVTGIETNSVVGTPAIGQIHTLSASDIQTTTVVGTPILSHVHVLSAVGILTSPVVDTSLIGQVHAFGSIPIIVSPTLGNPVVGQIHILDAIEIATNPNVGSPSWDLIEGPVGVFFSVIYPDNLFTVILPEIEIETPNT